MKGGEIKIKNSKLKIQNLGFTLIELLVVISIIGILASLALVSYGGAQKQSRDAIRKSDLEQYRNALEGYAGANAGKYPGFSVSTVTDITPGRYVCGPVTASYSLLPFLSDTCLVDPNPTSTCSSDTGRQYCYFEDGTANGATAINYLLYGGLETGGFWEICSNGKAGKVSTRPANVNCGL